MAKIIYSKHLPIGREMNAMAVWPFIIVKMSRAKYFTARVERHERIHLAQQKELFLIGFFILYVLFFLIKQVACRKWMEAYKRNPFEREAYAKEKDAAYLESRKHYSWTSYL